MRQSPGRPGVRVRRHRRSSTERQISITIQRSSVPLRWCAGRVRLPVGELDLDAPVSFFEFGVVHTGADLEAEDLEHCAPT